MKRLLAGALAGLILASMLTPAYATSNTPFQLYYSAIGANGVQITQYNTFVKIPSSTGIDSASYTIYPNRIHFVSAQITGGTGPQTFDIGEQYGNITFNQPWTGTDVYVSATIASGKTNGLVFFYYSSQIAQIIINGHSFGNIQSLTSPVSGGSTNQIYYNSTGSYIEVQTYVTPSTIDFSTTAPAPSSGGGGAGGGGGGGTVVITKTINGTLTTVTQAQNTPLTTSTTNPTELLIGLVVFVFIIAGGVVLATRRKRGGSRFAPDVPRIDFGGDDKPEHIRRMDRKENRVK